MDTGCDNLVGDEFAFETARSPSSAKKQRREDPPEPPSSVEEETDPRSEIKVYKYDSDVEDDSTDGMHEMTEKVYEEYHRQLEESEGFEVMDFPWSFSCGLTFPVMPQGEFWGQLKPLSELALKEFNEKQVGSDRLLG
ncbi:hypothetical protein RHMOL_Rhmol02G0219600 [Rhododendron molle]|uniref:Uncharacterized protein n=1 Tax=Rhododendron molle TaxID=49168 RepID=A0ACC0PU47_RHOML|nr:hypothetical protein RHMOL_Rhmol02G0219600 [Rhododendron molle]